MLMMLLCLWNCRTYADKLSAKVVQSLLDLLCSQLKNLLSQAGVSLLSSGSNHDNGKHDDGADSEKKDFRGEEGVPCRSVVVSERLSSARILHTFRFQPAAVDHELFQKPSNLSRTFSPLLKPRPYWTHHMF